MTDSERQILTIFADALAQPEPAARPAYLDKACCGDDALRARVEALLRAHQDAGQFLQGEPPESDRPAATLTEGPHEHPGTTIGPYKLVELIGEGGMGTVWMAQQTEPVKRVVALKLIKAGMDSRQVIARFEAERQALALMDHANIAHALDAGTSNAGRPYFVMDLVKGVPITKYCDEHHLTPRARLELFIPVCQAVQHAHQKGVIHRDLKPSNVLIALYDGKPVPKIIDFGVAKAIGQPLTEQTLVTGFGAIVGTLEYMSPEQAGTNNRDIDTRSDIYALGVLLYELLTGSPPFSRKELEQAGVLEMLRAIREEEPSKPSTKLSTSASIASIAAQRHTEPGRLSKLVRGDLDWIALKCLEKDRARRYETANSLAQDIQHYLNDEPIGARPPSSLYRLSKFVRRNKASVMAAFLALLALLVGIVGTTWGLLRAEQNRQKAESSLVAETSARQAEKELRDQAIAALRSMTDEIVQHHLARATFLREEDKEFLRKIITHFEGVAAIAANDAHGRVIRAVGNARVGEIRQRLGELKEAETALAGAVGIWKQLADEFPDQPNYRQELAGCHINMGVVLRASGRWKDAEAANAQALAIYVQLAAEFPTRPELRQLVAQSHNNLGNVFKGMGRLNEAAETYADAVASQRQLAADFPTRADFRRHLAVNQSNLGDFLRAIGQLKKAEESLSSALAIQKQLVTEFPDRPEFRQELATSCTNMGILLRVTDRSKEAEAAHAEAQGIYKRLAAEFPSIPEFRLQLSLSENNLARLLNASGRRKDAETAYSDALAIQRRLASDFPTVPDFRLQLARTQNNLASFLSGVGRFSEAETLCAEAQKITKQLTAEHPAVFEFREELASSHNNLGVALRRTGRLAEAQAAYAEGAAIRKCLVDEFPNLPDLQQRLAGALCNLGIVAHERGDFPAAKRYLEEAQAHHRLALKANSRHPDYRKYYLNTLRLLASTNASLNDQAATVAVARHVRTLGWDPPTDAYHAARTLAQCIPIVQKLEPLDTPQRQEAMQFYAEQAMALLRDAVAKGWKAAAQTRRDTDLDGLRQRKDFQELLKELDRK